MSRSAPSSPATRTSSAVTRWVYLLRLVRNNLFHGGKYEFGAPAEQVERDTAIIRASLLVLDQCFEHHPQVKVEVEQVAAA